MLFSSTCLIAALGLLVSTQNVAAQTLPASAPPTVALAPLQLSGLHRFYRVNDHLYRSAQPTSEGFHTLAKMGIKTVIDLRSDNEGPGEAKLLESLGVKYVSVPMPALAAPSIESVKRVLALVMDSGAWPVLVHCQRGADRTGTVIACFRISQDGWSNQRALEEASRLGMYAFQKAKKQFILDWPAMPTATASASPAQAVPAN